MHFLFVASGRTVAVLYDALDTLYVSSFVIYLFCFKCVDSFAGVASALFRGYNFRNASFCKKSDMQDESQIKMEISPKKIVEPVLTIPKPRPQIHHQLQQQQQQNHQQHQPQQNHHLQQSPKTSNGTPKMIHGTSKYAELLHVIGELGQHIRPSYTGHRGSSEKIRHGIIKARALVRECLIETEKSGRQ